MPVFIYIVIDSYYVYAIIYASGKEENMKTERERLEVHKLLLEIDEYTGYWYYEICKNILFNDF